MKISKLISTTALLLISINVANLEAKEIKLSQDKAKDLSITIYNDNLALVKDKRNIELENGISDIAFEAISNQIKPETSIIKSEKVKILEQNFDYDVLTAQKILEKSIGKKVKVVTVNPKTGSEKAEYAKVLSEKNGGILKFTNGIEASHPGRIVFSEIPSDLRVKPTLVIKVNNEGSTKEKDIELTYLTNGIRWEADYIAKIDNKKNTLSLNGWVTINNNSGTSYKNTKLQLIAGSVNTNSNRFARPMRMMAKGGYAAEMAFDAMPEEEAFADYHLYTLPLRTTIKNNQKKQVNLLSNNDIKFIKEYIIESPFYLRGSGKSEFKKLKPSIKIKFDNKKEHNLGIALPKGNIRVYEEDSKGNNQFIGENTINHTAKNEEVEVKIGEAFDVTVEGKVLNHRNLSKTVKEKDIEVIFKNTKSNSVTVKFEQQFSGNWKVLTENISHVKQNANKAYWEVKIPADSETKLTFTSQISTNNE